MQHCTAASHAPDPGTPPQFTSSPSPPSPPAYRVTFPCLLEGDGAGVSVGVSQPGVEGDLRLTYSSYASSTLISSPYTIFKSMCYISFFHFPFVFFPLCSVVFLFIHLFFMYSSFTLILTFIRWPFCFFFLSFSLSYNNMIHL